MSRQVWPGSGGEYQADEQAGVARLSWRVSGGLAGRCRAAQLASIRQMISRETGISGNFVGRIKGAKYRFDLQYLTPRGSAGEYQADEQAGVARLGWRVSGR